jgi:hypothetical protein
VRCVAPQVVLVAYGLGKFSDRFKKFGFDKVHTPVLLLSAVE